ncbi:MAG: aldose epimerase family protein [Jejuia sp.]
MAFNALHSKNIGLAFLIFIFFSCDSKNSNILVESWGNLEDKPISLYTLKNKNGVTAQLTNYGAILTSLKTPDKQGNFKDIVLGFDNLQQYVDDNPCFGATVGRYANRIKNAQFTIDSVTYNLKKNDGNNNLHGGLEFNKAIWQGATFSSDSTQGVVFKYVSKDGAMGFPGSLDVTVRYTLTNTNDLKIDYKATTDAKTHVNLTNHSYFNLAGTDQLIYDHQIKIDADYITTIDEEIVPTGGLTPVRGTTMDLNNFTRIGDRIHKFSNNGYHFCYVFNKPVNATKKVIEVIEPNSGRTMSVTTSQPSVQFYSGNAISETLVGKNNTKYQPHSAFCLETQHLPNTPNIPNFPSTLLNPEETYKEQVIYSFGIQKN